MNYENMIQRAIDGLDVIEGYHPSADVAVHAHILAVPDATEFELSKADLKTLKDKGWTYHKDFGWLLPVIG